MPYKRTKPTDWNKFIFNRPTNPIIKLFYFNVEFRAYKRLLKNATFNETPAILELGSASGYISKKLCHVFGSKTVTLVDSNEAMLNIAKRTFKNVTVNAEFILANFFNYQFKKTFQLVHSGGVLEHFDPGQQDQLVKIHADLLSPGGYCIIFVPTPTSSYKMIRKIAEFLHLWIYTDEIPMPESRLVEIMERNGLTILDSTYFWKHYWLSEIGVIAQKN